MTIKISPSTTISPQASLPVSNAYLEQDRNKWPLIAIVYDFDKTLSPKDMQEYGIIPGLGMTSAQFWGQVNELVDKEGMDGILAYTFLMIEKSRQKHIPITKETFLKVGQEIEFFKGVWTNSEHSRENMGTSVGQCVAQSEGRGANQIEINGTAPSTHESKSETKTETENDNENKSNRGTLSTPKTSDIFQDAQASLSSQDSQASQQAPCSESMWAELNWFERINNFCAAHQLQVEHYIVSSGIKDIILGTPIAKYFKKIYACDFLYDEYGQIQWPKNTLNYTTKTQFMFRINKGVLDINSSSDKLLNDYTPEEQRRIPFSNMIYIGDGYTDVPCMKLIKAHGGHSIAVFNQTTEPKIFSDPSNHTATELLRTNRVHTIANADYSAGSPLEHVVQVIIEKIRADETLKATVPLF